MISVIVPVYNVEMFLDRCIESLLKQNYKDEEIILVDDGSTDNSGMICERWAEKDSRIIVVHQENKGLSGARNTGISKAKGDYLAFVDSDDFVEPEYLEKMYQRIVENDADIVFCNYRFTDEKGKETNDRFYSHFSSDRVLDGYDVLMLFENKSYFTFFDVCWNKLYKRKLFAAVEFPEGISRIEDISIMPYIYHKAKRICAIEDVLYNYVCREASLSRVRVSKEEDCVLRASMMENRLSLYEEWGIKELSLIHMIHMFSMYSMVKNLYENRLKELQKEFRKIYLKKGYYKKITLKRRAKFFLAFLSLRLYNGLINIKA